MFAPRIDGIDVAHYQDEHGTLIHWPTVRANCARPDFAVASFKVTQGTADVDRFFAENRKDTAAAGFRWRCGYHWLSHGVDPIRQANWFLSHFTPGDNEFVCLDAEEAGISESQVLAWCQYVESVTHRPVAVYTGVHTAGGTIWKSKRVFNGQRIRWVAAYEPELAVRAACQPFGFDAWQPDGGATGVMIGVTGPCDLDYVEHPIMFDLACAIPAIPPAPPVVKPPTFTGAIAMLVNNSQATMAADVNGTPAGYGPTQVKWIIEDDGHGGFVKKHLSPSQYALIAGAAEGSLSNAQLVAIPDAI